MNKGSPPDRPSGDVKVGLVVVKFRCGELPVFENYSMEETARDVSATDMAVLSPISISIGQILCV